MRGRGKNYASFYSCIFESVKKERNSATVSIQNSPDEERSGHLDSFIVN